MLIPIFIIAFFPSLLSISSSLLPFYLMSLESSQVVQEFYLFDLLTWVYVSTVFLQNMRQLVHQGDFAALNLDMHHKLSLPIYVRYFGHAAIGLRLKWARVIELKALKVHFVKSESMFASVPILLNNCHHSYLYVFSQYSFLSFFPGNSYFSTLCFLILTSSLYNHLYQKKPPHRFGYHKEYCCHR